jgi:hypothetical protein
MMRGREVRKILSDGNENSPNDTEAVEMETRMKKHKLIMCCCHSNHTRTAMLICGGREEEEMNGKSSIKINEMAILTSLERLWTLCALIGGVLLFLSSGPLSFLLRVYKMIFKKLLMELLEGQKLQELFIDFKKKYLKKT